MPNGVPGASSQEEVNEEPPGGVTPEAPAAPSEAMRKQAATARFRKMVLGVTGGPRPSGDEVVLEKHTCGTLKTCKQSVALLNLKTNAAVHECCGRLDDQEGRAFLAADQMWASSLCAMRPTRVIAAATRRASSVRRSTSC